MTMIDFDYSMMLVSKVLNREELPKGWEGREDEIMYAYEAAKLAPGQKNPYYPMLRSSLEKHFDKYIKGGFNQVMRELLDLDATVLDVGCGNGQYLRSVTNSYQCTGIDNKPVKVEGKYEFIQGSFPEDLNGQTYDCIIMAEYLHLFNEEGIEEQIAHAKAHLNPGGHLIVIENNPSIGLNYRLKKLGGGGIVSPEIAKRIWPLPTHWIGTL